MLENAELTAAVLSAAIEVHKTLGPGFLERVYEEALVVELRDRGHRVDRQVRVALRYKDREIGAHVLDLVVEQTVVVELKSVSRTDPKHLAILRSYLKATKLRYGLILNFGLPTLGITRVLNC